MKISKTQNMTNMTLFPDFKYIFGSDKMLLGKIITLLLWAYAINILWQGRKSKEMWTGAFAIILLGCWISVSKEKTA